MPFAHLTASKSKSQVFDDVCSELAMAILQFFQVIMRRRRLTTMMMVRVMMMMVSSQGASSLTSM